jgi:hypothetical protein
MSLLALERQPRYGRGARERRRAARDVSLALDAGEPVAAGGCGAQGSTLLVVAAGTGAGPGGRRPGRSGGAVRREEDRRTVGTRLAWIEYARCELRALVRAPRR